MAYVGSQADKFKEAVQAMDELLTSMPTVEKNLNIAKTQLKKEIESERITQDGIIYSYLAAKELGLNYDIRKNIYNNIDNVSMKDLTNFHSKYLAKKPYTYVILASEKNISTEELKKIGKFKKLSLEELFGY